MTSKTYTISPGEISFLGQMVNSGDFYSYYGVIESYGSPYGTIGKDYVSYSGSFWDLSSPDSWLSDRYTYNESWLRQQFGMHENNFSQVRSSVQKDLVFEHYDFVSRYGTLPTTKDIFDMHTKVFEKNGIGGSWIGETMLTGPIVDWVMGVEPTDPQCFLAGTKIDMWPLADGKAWTKPIETVTHEDVVVSYDDEGNLVPGRVTRTFQNTVKHILDLPVPVLKDVDHKLPENAMPSGQNQMYNLMITPGHVTYCAKVEGEDNPYADSHVPILDILRSDGALMMKDGTLVRASTGCDVNSFLDRKIWAIAGRKNAFGQISVSDKGQIRLGTKFVTDDGQILTVLDMIGQMGAMLNQDGLLVRGPQDRVGTMFHWEHSYKLPNPEDYVLQRSNLTLEEIYDADEWEAVAPDLPAPKPMMIPSTPQERVLQASSKDAMAPNIPTSMFDAANQPTMSRKQRRAHEAKMRQKAKAMRKGAMVH